MVFGEKLRDPDSVPGLNKERDKADPATMPIQYLTSCDFSYNPDTAAVLGVEIPAELR